jgi:hypothetical protein
MAKKKRKCTADQMETAAYELLCRMAQCLTSAVSGLSREDALDVVTRHVLTWKRKQQHKRK